MTQQFAALSLYGPVLQLPACGSSKAEKGGSNHGANQHQQQKFSWAAVAAAGISGSIYEQIERKFKIGPDSSFGDRLSSSVLKGITGATGNKIVNREGKMDWAHVAADAFGNALGNSIAENNWGGSQQESELTKFRRSEIEAMNADARAEASMGLGSGLNPYRSSEPGLRISERDYADWSNRIDEGIQYEATRQMTAGQRNYLQNTMAGIGLGIGSTNEPIDNSALLNATERAINPGYYESQVIGPVPGYPDTDRNIWCAQNDAAFIRAARDANEGLGILEGQRGYIDAKTLKAWAMVKSGGTKNAFLTDPLQVNNSGDWDDKKKSIGLIKHQDMDPYTSAKAAIQWWRMKSEVRNDNGVVVDYRSESKTFERYNGNTKMDKSLNGVSVHHYEWYANEISRLRSKMK